MPSNYSLKEDIRAYWSARAETFDASASHGIATPRERAAWQGLMRGLLGASCGGRVLELASGTGEVTRLLLDLGCEVTGLDLAEPMVRRARAKLAGRSGWRIFPGDAEATGEPDGRYDAVVCRNLVWTLVDPVAALADWHRVLRPGGVLVVIDGDWVRIPLAGRVRAAVADLVARLPGQAREPRIDWEGNARIQSQVYFAEGLTAARLAPLLRAAGFGPPRVAGLGEVYRAQRAGLGWARWAQRLRAGMYREFALSVVRG